MQPYIIVEHDNKLEGVFASLGLALRHMRDMYRDKAWRVEDHYIRALRLHTFTVYTTVEGGEIMVHTYIISQMNI